MDWKEYNQLAFKKEYKVFTFLSTKSEINFFDENTFKKLDDCLSELISLSSDKSTIHSKQNSKDSKGWLGLGRMIYSKKNLIKCITEFRSQNDWNIWDIQIWSSIRKKTIDENRFPEFVIGIDFSRTIQKEERPFDNTLSLSFDLNFYILNENAIKTAIKKIQENFDYSLGYEFTRPWFNGYISESGIAMINSVIASVDNTIDLYSLINSHTKEWNNNQCKLEQIIQFKTTANKA